MAHPKYLSQRAMDKEVFGISKSEKTLEKIDSFVIFFVTMGIHIKDKAQYRPRLPRGLPSYCILGTFLDANVRHFICPSHQP